MLSTIKTPTGGTKLMAAAILLLAAGLTALLVSAETASANIYKMSQSAAEDSFRATGQIYWTSSGNCTNRYNSTCTSFSQINNHTVFGVKAFRNASGCTITITGGTEIGHASGTYSHWNGYKVDIRPTTCVSNYIRNNYQYIGGSKYRSGQGNIYYNEGDHWDITYYDVH
jgi:hypothetical protein